MAVKMEASQDQGSGGEACVAVDVVTRPIGSCTSPPAVLTVLLTEATQDEDASFDGFIVISV